MLTFMYNKLYHVHVLLWFNYFERLKIQQGQKNSIIITHNYANQINNKLLFWSRLLQFFLKLCSNMCAHSPLEK